MKSALRNSRRRLQLQYVVGDICAVIVAFIVFSCLRYGMARLYLMTEYATLWSFLSSPTLVMETILFPIMTVGLSWITGFYGNVFIKSRLHVIGNTALVMALTSLIFFLTAMTNDVFPRRRLVYEMMWMCFGYITLINLIVRLLINGRQARRIADGRWSIPTLVIGATPKACNLARRIMKARPKMGLRVIGLTDIGDEPVAPCPGLPVYAPEQVRAVCRDEQVRAIVLAPARSTGDTMMAAISRLLPLDTPIYICPDPSDLSQQRRGLSNVAGEPLIDISSPQLSPSTINIKRVIDLTVAGTALVVLSPLMAAIALAIKVDSPGPVFYRQRRVGYHKKVFSIIKFRSMRHDAESDTGPRLSSPTDKRVTRVGRVLRKYRLDELPNFINVMRGEMSLVGPRPERPYYVRRLLKREPGYALIHSVRPGITSWGMVKYGYAQTVDEMVNRLQYDLLYIQNVSISVDLKILFYTVRTVVTGKGL